MDDKSFKVYLRGKTHYEDHTLIADIKNYASEDMTIFVTTASKYEYIKTNWDNWDVKNVIKSRNVMPIEYFTAYDQIESATLPYDEPGVISFYDYCDFTPEQLIKSYFLVKEHHHPIAVKVLEDNLHPLTKLQLQLGRNYKIHNNGVSENFIETLTPDAAIPYCNFITEPKAQIINKK